jgi:RND family efflux transporter MFP subunit
VHDQKDILVPARPPAPPRTGRYLTIVAIAVLVALLLGFFIVERIRSHKQSELDAQTLAAAGAAPAVDVVRAQPAPQSRPLELPGETRGWYQTTIYARVPGYLANWLVDIGDKVGAGQLLCKIDTPDLDAQLAAAQAHLKVSQSQVEVEAANVSLARTTYDRWWNAQPANIVSEQERQEKKAAWEAASARRDAAESQVKLDQAELDRLNALEGFKQVTAPFDGVITARRIDIGDLVTAGSTTNTTSLYSIAQTDKIRVFVDVPQDAAMQITTGTAARIISADLDGHDFDGKVARTSVSIDPASKTMKVEVDLDNPQLLLVPGMYVRVTFKIHQPVWVQVPASAITFRSRGPQVAVITGDNQVSFHDISIAQDQGDVVYIGSGLAPGDRVALNISNQIDEGEKVDVHEIGGAPAAATPAVTTAQQE